MQIKWLGNACIEIDDKKNILIDPNYLAAPDIDPDIVLITHEHSDHIAPEKIDRFNNYQLYAPALVFEKYDISGNAVEDGDTLEDDIHVIGCDCYGSDEAVCYFYNGLYHTADASSYADPGDKVKLLFTACFPNLYDEYKESIDKIGPEIIVPYHFDPREIEELEEARGLKDMLVENNMDARILNLREEITI